MASGARHAPLAEGAALLQRASATGEPIFVGLCLDVERGPVWAVGDPTPLLAFAIVLICGAVDRLAALSPLTNPV